MNKKIVITAASVLSLGILTTGVLAVQSNNLSMFTVGTTEVAEVAEALSTSNVLRAANGRAVNRDNVDDAETFSDDNQLQTASMSESNGLTAQSGIKIYNVEIDESTQSIYNTIDTNDYNWLVPSTTEEGVSFAFLKKGKSLSEIRDKINSLNISEEHKEKMIKTATEREGKWYVSRVEQEKDAEKAETFINYSVNAEQFAQKGISNVIDCQYICMTNNGIMAVVVKTPDSETIIPYNVTENSGLNNDSTYSLSDLKQNILD